MLNVSPSVSFTLTSQRGVKEISDDAFSGVGFSAVGLLLVVLKSESLVSDH